MIDLKVKIPFLVITKQSTTSSLKMNRNPFIKATKILFRPFRGGLYEGQSQKWACPKNELVHFLKNTQLVLQLINQSMVSIFL